MMALSKSKPERTEGAETRSPCSGGTDNAITERIIGAAIEVHRHLGPGLLESAYEECLCYELSQRGLRFQRQVPLPIYYKGIKLQCAHKMDLLVEDAVIVEIKATEETAPVHSAQLLTYLKSSNKRIGLLINFNVPILKNGLKRIVNHYTGPSIGDLVPAPCVSESEEGREARQHETPFDSSLGPSPRLRVSASKKEPQ